MKKDVLSLPVTMFGFGKIIEKIFANAEIKTFEDIVRTPVSEMMRFRNMNLNRMERIQNIVFKQHGYKIGSIDLIECRFNLNTPTLELMWSKKAHNALKYLSQLYNIVSIKSLLQFKISELRKFSFFNDKVVVEIMTVLEDLGFSFAAESEAA